MKKTVTLDELEWGQILDGLSYRVELYENAVRYYEEGYCEGEIAEVSGEDEARRLQDWYLDIIARIQKQIGPN
ncbi:MAG TPA: hypothetical protein PLP16_12290 [Smithellaceae bacterium]|nr:hypothetical protein [Smithellaceae bacterium]